MRILFAVSDDLRVNVSHNIRNASLIKLLSADNEVYVIMGSSAKGKDSGIVDTLYSSCLFCNEKLQSKPDTTRSIQSSGNKKRAFASNIKSFCARTFSRISPVDPGIIKVNQILRASIIPDKVDVIITSSDPISSHYIGIKLKKQFPYAVWIQYWGDVMSEDVQYNAFRRACASIIERMLLMKGDHIVYTNPLVKEYIQEKYKSLKSKISWFPTPFEIGSVPVRNTTKHKIGYFGAYGSKNRDIRKICEAAIEAKIEMIVVGNGDVELPEGIEKRPKCPIDVVNELEKNCSIIVINENKYIRLANGDMGCLQVPGKLYHFSNSSFYLLVPCEGHLLKKEYSRYNRFIFCENRKEQLIQAITDIVDGKYDNTIHPVHEFSGEVISEQWNRLMRPTND